MAETATATTPTTAAAPAAATASTATTATTAPITPSTQPGNATEAPKPNPYPTVEQVVQAFPEAEPSNVRASLPHLLKAMCEAGLTSKNQLIGLFATINIETLPRFVSGPEGGRGKGKKYGPIFFGRGFIQLTWEENYRKAEKDLKIAGLVANPDLALVPETSARITCWYWTGNTGNNPAKWAEQANWERVRKAVNGGLNGWDKFKEGVDRASKIFTQDLDPAAIGAMPVDGAYGLGCADPGAGGVRSISGSGATNQGMALAHALGITARAMSRATVANMVLDPGADPAVLDLEAQKTFEMKNVGEGFDGTYTVDEVVYEYDGDGLSVRLTGYQPDPNAPSPQAFVHNSNGGVGPTQPNFPAGAVPAGEIPNRIYQAAVAASAGGGKSTRSGPGGGNISCAYAVNLFCILPAGLANIGKYKDPNFGNVSVAVLDMLDALKSGRGQQVDASQAVPGDLVIVAGSRRHIGVYLGNNRVISNSSSKAAFRWTSGLNFDGFYGSSQPMIFRVLS